MSGVHLSKEFFELVKSIGESRSKQEEDKIIVAETCMLKQHLSKANISPRKMKEYMIRAVYVEMLGHDASFAYIHAVKLTTEKNLLAKRIGYLTCNLFLHKDHELMLLLINTMQRDLSSPNHLEVCAALNSVCRLVSSEMIPALSPLVFKLLTHAQELVRKKAIVAVCRFFKLVPETVTEQKELIRKALCDPDPSVMGASLHIFFEFARANPTSCKDLVPSFVSILKQITEHRLPRDFDYHRMPAPWLQVKLLSILGLLGTADQKASEQMYEIIEECMRRADSGVNVGNAIIYECVKCIAKIYPEHSLLALGASNISRFIASESHNLKYLGVTGLAQIVQINPSYATEHQMAVVDCLEDPDETLKRKTLDLLYRMTNPQNIAVVVEKLTFHLRTSVDVHLRRELVQRITSLAERFAPDNEWYVITMNTMFELGGDLVPQETAYNLMRLVAEGTGEDETADQEFRRFVVNTYLKLLEKVSLSDVLVQVIAWVLGEYATLASLDGYSFEDIVDLLCETVDRPFEDPSTRGYVVTALAKLVGQRSLQSSGIRNLIQSYRSSRYTDLQQRCYEFEQLCIKPRLMTLVLPYDASCEDIDVDPSLYFLNDYVSAKLKEDGMKPYLDPSQRASLAHAAEHETKSGLNFVPYEAPLRAQPGHVPVLDTNTNSTPSGPVANDVQTLHISGPRKWGPSGYGGSTKMPPQQEEKFEQRSPEPAPIIASSTRPVPQKETVPDEAMNERQRMAKALFSGLADATPTVARPAPQTVDPKPSIVPTAPAPAAPPVPSTNVTDLLDLDDFGAAPPSAGVSTSNLSGSNDILNGEFHTGLSPKSTAPVSTPLELTGLGDMLGDTAPPPVQPQPQVPLLSPLQITMQQYGPLWQQLPYTQRLQVHTSLLSTQDMLMRMQMKLSTHPVQVIGAEGISAGRTFPANDPVLVHGKLTIPTLEITVKCQNSEIGMKVAELCQNVLA